MRLATTNFTRNGIGFLKGDTNLTKERSFSNYTLVQIVSMHSLNLMSYAHKSNATDMTKYG